MKKFIACLIVFQLFFLCLVAQPFSLPPVDKSPMDMSYYPSNYPVLKIQDKVTEPLVARIVYSRPQKSNRAIFGGLVQYGELWRLGANEATEIEFYKNVHVGGKKVSKGRYTMYAIVNEKTWTININKDTDTWGAFKYNAKKDVLRVDVPVVKSEATIEFMVMAFEKSIAGFNLVIAWENTRVNIPMTF